MWYYSGKLANAVHGSKIPAVPLLEVSLDISPFAFSSSFQPHISYP